MPLNAKQEEFIRDTLGDYVDEFIENATDASIFLAQMHELEDAALGLSSEANSFLLAHCLRDPERFLLKLEMIKLRQDEPDITVREVKTYIAHFITPKINEKAAALNISLRGLWEIDRIVELMQASDSRFQSEKSLTDGGGNPYTREDPDRVFTVSVLAQFPWLFAHVETNLGGEVTYDNKVKLMELVDDNGFPFDFVDDDDEDRFLRTQLQDADSIAIQTAAHNVMGYLLDKNLVQPDDITDIFENTEESEDEDGVTPPTRIRLGIATLLTHKYYFKLLAEQKVSLDELKNPSDDELSNLLDPTVLRLHAHGVLRIRQARKLQPGMLKLFSTPFYQKILLQNHHKLYEYLALTEKQVFCFIQPAIVNLRQLDLINENQAYMLSPHHIPLIANPFYNAFILKNASPALWQKIRKLNLAQCRQLLRANIIAFISENNLTEPVFASSLLSVMTGHFGLYLAELILFHQFPLETAQQIPLRARLHLEKHPYMKAWLKSKLLGVSDLIQHDTLSLSILVLAKRMFVLCTNRAPKSKEAPDTLENIDYEISRVADYYQRSKESLKELICKELLRLLKKEFDHLAKSHERNALIAKHYQIFSRMINNAIMIEQRNECASTQRYWQSTLGRLIELVAAESAKTEPTSLRKLYDGVSGLSQFGIFKLPKRKAILQVRGLSAHLNELNNFCDHRRQRSRLLQSQ